MYKHYETVDMVYSLSNLMMCIHVYIFLEKTFSFYIVVIDFIYLRKSLLNKEIAFNSGARGRVAIS